jgi:murein L,D-transpeptidase YcbB/YkuD
MAVIVLLLSAGPLAQAGFPMIGESQYQEMLKARDNYQYMVNSGQWRKVPNRRHPEHLQILARNLQLSGDLPHNRFLNFNMPDPQVIDEAVRNFQFRHGLKDDGVVGPSTLAALNVSPNRRLRTVINNLARINRLRDPGDRYVVVNTAGNVLQLVEQDYVSMEMKVINGQRGAATQTPDLTSKIDQLVLNPSWNVPPGIMKRKILPAVHRDPGYLDRNGYRIFDRNGRQVPAYQVDWRRYRNEAPYRVEKPPGPNNPLGRIKFQFPNRHLVYLHDTNEPQLFNRSPRFFSSGCVRVEKPFELAAQLWQGAPLGDMVAGGKTRYLNLQQPVNIHLVYLTAWVDRYGQLQFRPDVYNRD